MTQNIDPIRHPPHYRRGKIEAIEVIEDWNLGYHLGNTLKYLCRAGFKDPSKVVEDLEKAQWYLSREIERRKNGHNSGSEAPTDG